MIRIGLYVVRGFAAVVAVMAFLRASAGGACIAEHRFGVCTHYEPSDRPEAPVGPAIHCVPTPSKARPTAVECE